MYPRGSKQKNRVIVAAEPKTKKPKLPDVAEASTASESHSVARNHSTGTSSSGFLHGVRACIIPLSFHQGRAKLLSKRITEVGVEAVVFSLNDFHSTKRCTHAIVDETVEVPTLFDFICGPNLIDLRQTLENVVFVRSKWLSLCLSGKKILPTNEFSLNSMIMAMLDSKLASLAKTAFTGRVSTTSTEAGNMSIDSDYNESDVEDEADTDSGEEVDESESSCAVSKMASKFVCSGPSSSGSKNLNSLITGQLEELMKTYKNTPQGEFRSMAYGKAVAAIRNYPRAITCAEDLKNLRNVGESIRNKILEILETGKCQKVEEFCQDNEFNQAVNLFCNIHGVSGKTAAKWASSNYRTLEDVKIKAKLNQNQQIGLKYYHEFLERIPRAEVVEIEQTVREAALELQEGLEIVTCGSYRRGKPTCGDVDILISHTDGKSHRNIFGNLLKKLHGTGFLTDDLQIAENSSQKKYLGVCLLPKEGALHRRLDIIVVPYCELATALLYFTGSAHFNRSMRAYAHKLNMCLSQHSLNKNVIRKNKVKIFDGEPLPTLTEKSVFDHLGLPYYTPEDRDH